MKHCMLNIKTTIFTLSVALIEKEIVQISNRFLEQKSSGRKFKV